MKQGHMPCTYFGDFQVEGTGAASIKALSQEHAWQRTMDVITEM